MKKLIIEEYDLVTTKLIFPYVDLLSEESWKKWFTKKLVDNDFDITKRINRYEDLENNFYIFIQSDEGG